QGGGELVAAAVEVARQAAADLDAEHVEEAAQERARGVGALVGSGGACRGVGGGELEGAREVDAGAGRGDLVKLLVERDAEDGLQLDRAREVLHGADRIEAEGLGAREVEVAILGGE